MVDVHVLILRMSPTGQKAPRRCDELRVEMGDYPGLSGLSQCNHRSPYKTEANRTKLRKKRRDRRSRGCGEVPDAGEKGPEPRTQVPPEAGEGRMQPLPAGPAGGRGPAGTLTRAPVARFSFGPLQLSGSKCMLGLATTVVVICYTSSRKLIQMLIPITYFYGKSRIPSPPNQ